MRTGRALAIASVTLVAFACGGDDEPDFTTGRRARAAEGEPAPAHAAPTAEPRAGGRWYSIELPEGAAPATVLAGMGVIDAVYVLDPDARVSLTVLAPVPGQSELAAWAAVMAEVFSEDEILRETDATVSGLPARVAVSASALRWMLVADGHGVALKCHAEEPLAEERLHAHCDAAVAAFRLARPVAR